MRLFLLSALVTAGLMEGWSALVHRVVWHGPLWFIHRSHHERRGLPKAGQRHPVRLELNDALVVVHAGAAITLMIAALRAEPSAWRDLGLGISAGMTFFGVLYGFAHDAVAHGRAPFLPRWLLRPWRRMVAAHRVHHVHGGAPYGFFFSPWLLRRAAAKARRRGQPSVLGARRRGSP